MHRHGRGRRAVGRDVPPQTTGSPRCPRYIPAPARRIWEPPLRAPDGLVVGALCAFKPSPRAFDRHGPAVSGCGPSGRAPFGGGGLWPRVASTGTGALARRCDGGADWEQEAAPNCAEPRSAALSCGELRCVCAGRWPSRWSQRCRPSVHTGGHWFDPSIAHELQGPCVRESADRGPSSCLLRGPSPLKPHGAVDVVGEPVTVRNL